MLCIVAWTATISLIYFMAMKKFNLLRVSLIDEIIGLDVAEHGSEAKVNTKIAEGISRSMTNNFQRTGDLLQSSPTLRKQLQLITEARQEALHIEPNAIMPETAHKELNTDRALKEL